MRGAGRAHVRRPHPQRAAPVTMAPAAVAVALLLLAAVAQPCIAAADRGEGAFIGWQGDTYVPPKPGDKTKKPWIQTISWKPRAFVYHNFLTDAEAEHIKMLAAPQMKRSTVVGQDGKSVQDEYRTSYGTFVKRRRDDIIARIDARVSDWVRIPEVHSEDLQVLRYGYLQTYKPHMDTLEDESSGARVCTVLLYLSDVEEGGETAFPDSTAWAHADMPKRMGPFSKCTEGGVAFKPKRCGDALLFWSLNPDSKTQDPASMHTGCPVLQGVKWTATKWIHGKPFRPETFGVPDPDHFWDPGLCVDQSNLCSDWAKAGQCEKNPAFMLGTDDAIGQCRLSCKACKPCARGDAGCYNKLRAAAGYLEAERQEAYLFPFLTDPRVPGKGGGARGRGSSSNGAGGGAAAA